MTGCDTEKRKNIVILIDNSASVAELSIMNYIKIIEETIIPNMTKNDKITILFIDGCSKGLGERIYSFDLADIDFTKPTDGVNHRVDSADARRKRFLNETVKLEMDSTVMAKRKNRLAEGCGQYTDIISTLLEAQLLVDTEKNYKNKTDKVLNNANGDDNFEYETCIVIFSDMVNENAEKTYDFTKFEQLSDDAISKKVLALKEQKKIANLENVKVIVDGTTGGEKVKLFWDKYFKLAGAEVKAYENDTRLELKKYLVKM